MCGFDYDHLTEEDVARLTPDVTELRQKVAEAYRRFDAEEEAWLELQLAQSKG